MRAFWSDSSCWQCSLSRQRHNPHMRQLSTTPSLSYDAQDVLLSYANSYAILVTPPGASQNQQNVINGINTGGAAR